MVRRIFEEFADGRSPKAIARGLIREGIPGPRGELWRDTAIRGHRQRGTGILNNELYLGRLIWNRLRYVKDPTTGRRVSRANGPADWLVTDVPHLKIIEAGLRARVKARQEAIDATPAVQGIKASRFWEHRRAQHLLTGLTFCGCCGGPLASVGRDYLACSAARKLGTCDARQGIRRDVLEGAILDLLATRLMQPDAVAAFSKAVVETANVAGAEKTRDRARLEAERAATKRTLDGLYDAIAEGLRTPGLLARLQGLEQRLVELDQALAAPGPSPIRLHPNLSEVYRRKVSALATALADPAIADPAREAIRGLIARVTVRFEGKTPVLTLDGALSALVALGTNAKGPLESGLDEGLLESSVKVVAGARYRRDLLSLRCEV